LTTVADWLKKISWNSSTKRTVSTGISNSGALNLS
jgi:hypothetical protein